MRVKGHGGGVWSRRANLFCGSRRPAAECGLGGRICRAGQRTCRWSVVCGEKTLRRSKKLSAECGLWRENAERVKGHVGGVWSRRANLPSGSKDLSVECGLGGEFVERVKGHVGGVWFVARKRCVGQRNCRRSVVCGEKTPSGSKDMSAECGLGGRTCRAGQRTCRWSVV